MRRFDFFLLKVFIRIHNYTYRRISYFSKKLNDGIHPKHRILKYHEFFLNNIEKNSKVLDIGCGIGELTFDLAKKASKVVACDINSHKLKIAQKKFLKDNIKYIKLDATKYIFNKNFDYIILSNVLEHIKERIFFLEKLKSRTKFFLIRVPMINRSWLTLYKKELGSEFRLDSSHFVEYTFETFQKEINLAGLKIISYTIQFGEIWTRIGV